MRLWLLAFLFAPAYAQFSETPVTDPGQVPSGTYRLDAGHGKITWAVLHHGLSTYIGQFTGVAATLRLNAANPSASVLEVNVDTGSVGSFNQMLDDRLKGGDWLDTADYPSAHYVSTSVTQTAPEAATIEGNLTLHGVTKPVEIKVKFNGYAPGRGTIGFDGLATITRSEFGVSGELPGVSDEVKLIIEGEFEAR